MLAVPETLEGSVFHAARRAAARRIMGRGFSYRYARPASRLGAKQYVSRSMKTAAVEKPSAKAIVSFKTNKTFKRNTLELKKLNRTQIKRISGDKDLRGDFKRGVPGYRIGKNIGKYSDRSGKIIAYPSVKNPQVKNYAIPKSFVKKHPRSIKPTRIYNMK